MTPETKGYRNALIYCAVCTVLFIILFTVNAEIAGKPDTLLSIIYTVIYLVLTVGGVFLIIRITARRNPLTDPAQIRTDIMKQALSTVDIAVILANEDGNILWCNEFAISIFPALKVGESIYTICGLRKEEDGSISAAGNALTVFGKHYFVHSTGITSGNMDSIVVVLRDITSEVTLQKTLSDSRLIAADIVIDVSKDLMPDLREGYVKAVEQVTDLLTEWSKELKGMLRSYESGRYMLIFTSDKLEICESAGFDILTRVKQITFGSDMTPMTLSVGIADISGDASLSDKYELARDAIELALQRGGDQVVIKGRDKDVFYGGSVKRERFQMKLEARMLLSKITPYILKSSNILIMGHKNADYDCFASCIGIAKICTSLGKSPQIVINRADRNIAKVLADVELSEEFGSLLTTEEAAKNTINPDTLLFIMDVNNPFIFGSQYLARNIPYIIIDHHRKVSTPPIGKVLYSSVMPSVSSASEIVAQMLEQFLKGSGELGKLLPTLLLTGILLDTNRFSRDCGTGTFAAAQFLKREGANVENAASYFTLPFENYKLELDIKQNIKIIDGKYAICVGNDKEPVADTTVTARIADDTLTLEGISASFTICRIGTDNETPIIGISARSDGEINVQVIMERLGGGGHHSNAGMQISYTGKPLSIISRELNPNEITTDVAYRLVLLAIKNLRVKEAERLPSASELESYEQTGKEI